MICSKCKVQKEPTSFRLEAQAEICGDRKYESEMRDLRYRIRVRRKVLAELEGENLATSTT